MASWLIPTLKAILPHVSDVVSAVRPAFTRKKVDTSSAGGDLLQQQIAELQTAAGQNADHIKELAAQLQSTVSAVEQAAALAEVRLRRAVVMCAIAMAIAVVSLFVALAALSLR
jgi:uncharacterized phage infection (PIP) family protein YhgE